jgi:3',5'-cyclic AMP phosphodiesterase CpdA
MTRCLLLLIAAAACGADLVHVSDTHVARFEGVHPALRLLRIMNAGSLGLMEKFVAEVNAMPAVSVVHTGDIVEAVCLDAKEGPAVRGQVDAAMEVLGRLRHPLYLALGNHDVECYRHDPARPTMAIGDHSVASEARSEWGEKYARMRERTYYGADLGEGYRLVMLDNGQEWSAAGKEFFAKQMEWLDRELRAQAKARVVIGMHIPMAKNERSDELMRVLRRHANVRLILCGHQHSDDLSWVEMGTRKVLQVRTAALNRGPGTWRKVRLLKDRVEVYATGEAERLVETLELR